MMWLRGSEYRTLSSLIALGLESSHLHLFASLFANFSLHLNKLVDLILIRPQVLAELTAQVG